MSHAGRSRRWRQSHERPLVPRPDERHDDESIGDDSLQRGGTTHFTRWTWIAFASDESGSFQVYAAAAARSGWSLSGLDGRRCNACLVAGRSAVVYANGGRLEAATLAFAPAFAVTARETIFETGISSPPAHA